MKHRLVAYSKETDVEAFAIDLPDDVYLKIVSILGKDPDDPHGIGCYEVKFFLFLEPAEDGTR